MTDGEGVVNRDLDMGADPIAAEAAAQGARQPFRWLDLLRPRDEGDAVGGERQRLRSHVAHAARILPPKGPIHGFVAQNPLQYLEHLPFDRAVREAKRLTGGQGYLSNEAFRRIYASGRITRDDLAQALDAQVPNLAGRPALEVRGRRVETRDVCLAQLLHGIDPLPHGTLQWQLTHGKATTRLRRDLSSDARAVFLDWARRDVGEQDGQTLEAHAVSALWAAILDTLGVPNQELLDDQEAKTEETLLDRVLGVARDGGMPLPLTDQVRALIDAEVASSTGLPERRVCRRIVAGLRPGELSRDGFQALEELLERRGSDTAGRRRLTALRHDDPRIEFARSGREALERDLKGIGPEGTLGDFCQRVTGARIVGSINDEMIKWCAAFLDEGLAGWPMPGREEGLFLAWRALAERDPAFRFLGVKNSAHTIRQLPPDPADAVILLLRTMGVPEEQWGAYLTHHLAALPGWAGMVRWRGAHPDYQMQQHCPIDLTQYLAIRLFYESGLVSTLCRDEWGIDGTVPALHRYFENRPGEYYARVQVAAGDLPDALAGAVVRIGQGRIALNWEAVADPAYGNMRNAKGLSRGDQWLRFAEMLYTYRHGTGHGHDDLRLVYDDAWRLLHLAQVLGLTADDIRSLPEGAAKTLLASLDDLPPSSHGPIWLEAYEAYYQGRLLPLITGNPRPARNGTRPQAQIIFCLDVREEGIRRHIEARSELYETFGTAGFFSVPMIFRPLSNGGERDLCPIVIKPQHTVVETTRPGQGARGHQREHRAGWLEALRGLYHRLEINLATGYFLIDLLGIFLGFAIVGRTVVARKWDGLKRTLRNRFVPRVPTVLLLNGRGGHESGTEGAVTSQAYLQFSDLEQADLVAGQLRMIGLTQNFARLIVFCGHGSTTENNPYAAGYHCGACGGGRGGPNGRAIAAMANNPAVRALLRRSGIDVPDDTHFLGAEHDTSADRVTYFDTEDVPGTHEEEFERLRLDLRHAAALQARERCGSLPGAPRDPALDEALQHVQARSLDWAQVYPEWGHSRCASMLIGRRELTRGVSLDRRAYLQSYDPDQDPDGAFLEEIMTAFIPVVRGIALDYYFSFVDSDINGVFGAGTKAYHNVVGLIGVMQGAGSDLKPGLPYQGVAPLHEPMRAQIIVESHPAKVASIVERNKTLENVFKNHWAHLIAWDPATRQLVGYQMDGTWKTLQAGEVAIAS